MKTPPPPTLYIHMHPPTLTDLTFHNVLLVRTIKVCPLIIQYRSPNQTTQCTRNNYHASYICKKHKSKRQHTQRQILKARKPYKKWRLTNWISSLTSNRSVSWCEPHQRLPVFSQARTFAIIT